MAQDTTNPFVLPGFGQQGESAHNPLFAGLEMMRQAWQNMAGAGRLDAAVMPPMSLDELDRRIRELQTVQNWLQLNATMLANTIQGLEIQRSTLATLKSFAGQGLPGQAAGAQADESSSPDYAQAAGDWWKLIQQQFDGLAAATTASLQGVADAAQAAAQPPAKSAAAKKPARRSSATRKPTRSSSARPAARPSTRKSRS
jgi:hypothetical protein